MYSAQSLESKDFAGIVCDIDTPAEPKHTFKVSEWSVVPAFRPIGFAESVNLIAVGRAVDLSPRLWRRIAELSKLGPNWNEEGAKPVKPYVLAEVVEALKRFMRAGINFREPFLAPTFDGFIQMEWHDDRRSMDIEATAKGWSLVGTLNSQSNTRHYFTAGCERTDFKTLEKFYQWFVGTELIWPSL